MKWIKNKINQFFCNHLYTHPLPIMNPETWDMEMHCGKCDKYVNVNKDYINGKWKQVLK